jgi:asparagine synthase (glutamine-hydrolysing)
MSVKKLYALKGDVVAQGVKAVTGLDLPVFPKRRFQHGAVREEELHRRLPGRETDLRNTFLAQYA